MGFSYFNPNPAGQKVGDCTVRAIAKATGKSWDEVYIGLCLQGLIMGDLPSANSVWGAYLGFAIFGLILRDGVFFYALLRNEFLVRQQVCHGYTEIFCDNFKIFHRRVCFPCVP